MAQKDPSLIDVHARSLPEAWERSVIECWQGGAEFRTEYDKPGDPPSRDSVARIAVYEPMSEPRLHKAIPAGLEDLEIYRQEVLFGVHDNWIDPEAGRWEYTYHERLFEYRVPGDLAPVDQIAAVIDKLSETPYTRRAQVVTWQCWQDIGCVDPPCLQRMWFRIHDDRLHLNVTMRSNDAFKAAFMNMYAFTELQAWVARRIEERTGRPLGVGRYIHSADSYHIYGSYFEEFEGFLRMVGTQAFDRRLISTEDVQFFFDTGRIRLFNNTQSDIPLPAEHLVRLYDEISEDRRGELDAKQLERMREVGGLES